MAPEREVPMLSEKRALSRLLISNSAWSLLNQFVRVASLGIVLIALSRHFGPQQFGALVFGLAFVRVFAVVAAFGMDRIIVRHLVEEPDAADSIVRRAFLLKLSVAAISYLAMLAIVFLVDPTDRLTLAITALAGASLLFQAFDVFDLAFQAQGRFRSIFIGRALPICLATVVKVAAVMANAPLLAFAAFETLEAACVGLVLFAVYRRTRTSGAPGSTPATVPTWKPLLAQGFPLLLSALAVMIYMRADILMLGKLAGYSVAGIYSAASHIFEASTLLPTALLPVLLPLVVRWRSRGEVIFHESLRRLFWNVGAAGVCMAVVLFFSSTQLIYLLFGPEYAAAAPILAILSIGGVFVFLGVAQSAIDVAEGLTWYAVVRIASGAAINVILNFILIPRYGAPGAAVATVIGHAWSAVFANALHPRTRAIFFMQLRGLCLLPLRSSSRASERNSPAIFQESIV